MTRIAYLEISPRQTGKTTRLAKMACELVAQGKQVVFVVHSPRAAKEWGQRHPELLVIADGQPLPRWIDPDQAVWFYDEFDWLKSVVVREGAYYATTAARLRVAGEPPAEGDVLMQLLEANGQQHVRHFWPFDVDDFVSENRRFMSAECFRLCMLGEFQA
ncbi:hypothetical protein [Pseudomonas putida]|uniref:Uncharacterized protein n=1 Tax=Pseudomonas putida TaxID=303 RepID=A0A1B2FE01_PSEPU|nr:hypothetical protein [Pseudomonas putida]ANY90446.1 hypothetical protein IEC33019_4964 [Pseudomonas putida]